MLAQLEKGSNIENFTNIQQKLQQKKNKKIGRF